MGLPARPLNRLAVFLLASLATLQDREFHTLSYEFLQRNEPSPELPRMLKSLEISLPETVLNFQSTTSNAQADAVFHDPC
jgi:hypothetical protein